MLLLRKPQELRGNLHCEVFARRHGAKRAPTPSRGVGRSVGTFAKPTPSRFSLRSADRERWHRSLAQHAMRDFPAFEGLASEPPAAVGSGVQLLGAFSVRPPTALRSCSHASIVVGGHAMASACVKWWPLTITPHWT